MDLGKYSKLKEILDRWHSQCEASFLTAENKEYLLGVYDGLNLLKTKDDLQNPLLSDIQSLLEGAGLKTKDTSIENLIKQGKILFDSRLVHSSGFQDTPLDEKEKLFIEKGTLNEKELNFLNEQRGYQKKTEELELEKRKTNEEKQRDLERLLSELEKAGVITILKNYVKKFGTNTVGKESIHLKKILEESGFNIDPILLNRTLLHLHNELWYETFVHRMLSNNPQELNDYINNFLELYGEYEQENMSYLERLLGEKRIQTMDLQDKVTEVKRKLELERFKNNLSIVSETISIPDCDKMSGRDFEVFLESLFKKMGYTATVTKGSGDQGADLIIEKLGQKEVVQSKKSQNKISNKAVQEIGTAVKHYDADRGIVVTNNFFHDSAIELAKSNGIELIDRTRLEELLRLYPIEKKNHKDSFTEEETDENGLPLLNDELFLKKIQELEGHERKPVEHRTLVKHLIKTRKFTENSANDMIWQMNSEKQIYEPIPDHYNTTTDEIKKKLKEEEKRIIILPQLFFDVLRSLEGDRKTPVEEKLFITNLVETGKFTEEEAKNLIRRLLRDASIYESRPGHYNRV
ncbi:MAG: restriction endonuclease [Candidatus Nitrosotenuis sp.]